LRKIFYDWFAAKIKIDGIVSVIGDNAFDYERFYKSGALGQVIRGVYYT
jgi:hypothetical protein